jgi:uncharacterized protein (TIGR02588 family)
MDREHARADEHRSEGSATQIPPLEWLAAGVGLLLTVAVFASIGWEALTQGRDSPVVTVEVKEVVAVAGGYRVEFRARNMGGATAAQVEIEGSLSDTEGSAEKGRVVLDYIPSHSQREGGLFFTRDPKSNSLTLRPLGFTRP